MLALALLLSARVVLLNVRTGGTCAVRCMAAYVASIAVVMDRSSVFVSRNGPVVNLLNVRFTVITVVQLLFVLISVLTTALVNVVTNVLDSISEWTPVCPVLTRCSTVTLSACRVTSASHASETITTVYNRVTMVNIVTTMASRAELLVTTVDVRWTTLSFLMVAMLLVWVAVVSCLAIVLTLEGLLSPMNSLFGAVLLKHDGLVQTVQLALATGPNCILPTLSIAIICPALLDDPNAIALLMPMLRLLVALCEMMIRLVDVG